MNKSVFLLPFIAIPILLVATNSDEKAISSGLEFGTSSVLDIGEEFVKKASIRNSTQDDYVLGTFREITQQEILKESIVHDPSKDEKIFQNGIRLSDDYNRISYDYSQEKIDDLEYMSELLDFQIKYQIYLTAVDSYTGNEDILIHKNSMVMELEKINQDIVLLKNSLFIEEGWESQSKYDKYKKFLPSMFSP